MVVSIVLGRKYIRFVRNNKVSFIKEVVMIEVIFDFVLDLLFIVEWLKLFEVIKDWKKVFISLDIFKVKSF